MVQKYIISIFSAVLLIIALFLQYALNVHPCKLCLMQRIPHYLVVTTSLFFFFLPKWYKSFMLCCFILYLTSISIATYTIFVQNGIISSECSAASVQTIEELRKSLESNNISCSDVKFYLFGFSLSFWNAFLSLVLSFYSLFLLLKQEDAPSLKKAP